MNFFELSTVIVVIAAGLFVGLVFSRLGLLGWVGGFIVGTSLAVLVYNGLRKLRNRRRG